MKKIATALSFIFAATAAIAQDADAPIRRSSSTIPYTKATYAFSPIHITEENIGLGMSAEIFPGSNGIVSIYLPFSIALSPRDDYQGDYGRGRSYVQQASNPSYLPPLFEQWNEQKETIYFYPGIKIYPTGAFKKVSYAIGANLVSAVGRVQQTSAVYKVTTQTSPYGSTYSRELASEQKANLSTFKFGAMLLNTVNIRPTQHFYIGVEFGLGYTYVHQLASTRENREALVQLGVKFGYAN